MDIKFIITTVIALGGLVLLVFEFLKNQKLQKKLLEMQQKMFDQQQEKEAMKELKETIDASNEKGKKKSESRIYCDHVAQKFKYLDFSGLNAILQKPLLLEQVYVKLKAKQSFRLTRYHSIADFKELDEEKAEKTDDDFVSVFALLRLTYMEKGEPLKLIILGQPGSGKTTLMKWIALQCACSSESESIFCGLLPVFIPLKDLGREPGETYRAKNILDLTISRLEHENLSFTFIREAFENNKLLFLLDGLDEVGDEDVRKEIIQWIQSQNIRKNSLLVTSRFSGLHEAKGLKFHDALPVFAVQDFNVADIERFLENWYRNIEIAVAGDVNQDDQERAVEKGEEQYRDLMTVIKDDRNQNLRQLAVNPLLLTIIAIVHRTRAVLPRERHKLYEECLKVMIELWNVANRRLNVSFSVDNSINNLSKIAVFLMRENRRELDLGEIKSLLPSEIEQQPLDFFLKEMVLKAGLLYQSEGKYGFLHLTFQEYLAAFYYNNQEDQTAILEFRDRDYWTETFKLFVNIGNPRQMFTEIIDNLEEKEYWRHMQLWDDCLKDIVVEETQREIELKFAKKVLHILPRIAYKQENEPLIIQLYAHYPLYEHAKQFVEMGWDLFNNNAVHPFMQSVGSSILVRADEDTRAQLVEQLKIRIIYFEKQSEKSPKRMLDFLFQNNNNFALLIAGRKSLLDFHFVLSKLKSNDFSLVNLALGALHDRSSLGSLGSHVDLVVLDYIIALGALGALLDLGTLGDLLDLLNLRYLGYLRDLHYLRYLRDLRDLFIGKYETVIKEHKEEIHAWTDKAVKKLHSLSDEELLEHFPGTSREELKAFREGNF